MEISAELMSHNVAGGCGLFLRISNDYAALLATPCDMRCDMKKPATTQDDGRYIARFKDGRSLGLVSAALHVSMPD